MTSEKKRWGDRRDGKWLRDIDPMHVFMPYMFPNRADNEAFLNLRVDLTAVNAYLDEKNGAGPEYRYTLFQVILAVIARTIAHRPKMNRFVKGCRVYQRDKLTMAFVVKKQFKDDAHEALAFLEFFPTDTMDDVHDRIMGEIHACRGDAPDHSTAAMNQLVKIPRFLMRPVMGILNILDFYGRVPDAIAKTDPNHASVFLSNFGSIKLRSGYHHLTNWGTNSIFVTLGERIMRPVYAEDGTSEIRPVMDIGITLDERIADGYYYSGTIKMIENLLQHPHLLDQPEKEPITC